ncbi:MAG: hypothetical protein AAFV62_08680 [Pseudomonadota bacterium]
MRGLGVLALVLAAHAASAQSRLPQIGVDDGAATTPASPVIGTRSTSRLPQITAAEPEEEAPAEDAPTAEAAPEEAAPEPPQPTLPGTVASRPTEEADAPATAAVEPAAEPEAAVEPDPAPVAEPEETPAAAEAEETPEPAPEESVEDAPAETEPEAPATEEAVTEAPPAEPVVEEDPLPVSTAPLRTDQGEPSGEVLAACAGATGTNSTAVAILNDLGTDLVTFCTCIASAAVRPGVPEDLGAWVSAGYRHMGDLASSEDMTVEEVRAGIEAGSLTDDAALRANFMAVQDLEIFVVDRFDQNGVCKLD